MNRIRLNSFSCLFIIIAIFCNNFKFSLTGENSMDFKFKVGKNKNLENTSSEQKIYVNKCLNSIKQTDCENMSVNCMSCQLNRSCTYGSEVTTSCSINSNVTCLGNKSFSKKYVCRYCFQTEVWEHDCRMQSNCSSVATPPQYYTTDCVVKDHIVCLGDRKFPKNVRCNWTRGHKWKSAFVLSFMFGGFGAERFYLGHWQEGIGKLFSFGGVGFWTLVDTILISVHYIGPADGSLYL